MSNIYHSAVLLSAGNSVKPYSVILNHFTLSTLGFFSASRQTTALQNHFSFLISLDFWDILVTFLRRLCQCNEIRHLI